MTIYESKRVAAVSMMRNDNFFVYKWVSYYGSLLGRENLFLIVDGHDQDIPPEIEGINIIRLPHIKLNRTKGDKNRSRLVSHFAKALFYRYHMVIAHDIDEVLVVDPKLNLSLVEYLSQLPRKSSYSALGLDVAQHLEHEQPIDSTKPFLEQRSYAHVSARYTKPIVACRPLTWGSGFHRVKWRNFRIDPNLYLFHFGMVDFNRSRDKIGDTSLQQAGWGGHFDRRLKLFELILKGKPIGGDQFFPKARLRQSLFRPIYALNKPGTLKEMPIVTIPQRFKKSI